MQDLVWVNPAPQARTDTAAGSRPEPGEISSANDLAAAFQSWTNHTVWQESETTTEEDMTMFRFMQRFSRDSQTRWRRTGPTTHARRHNHQPNCEALEGRQLLSGYYVINTFSGKVLDDPGFSTRNGVQMDQWQLNGGANQRWNFVGLSNGNYAIVNAYSGKVLGDPGYSTRNGTGIVQWQWNGGLNEQWQLDNLGNGSYAIVNAYSGLVLGDPGYSKSNGCGLIQWQWNGGLNEQWTLLNSGDGPVVKYYVATADSGGAMVLDDPNFSTSNGTTVIQSYYNGGANQEWLFIPLSNGNDLIVSASSGLALDDPNFSTSNGTHLDLWQPNGGLNQQWQVDSLGNGNFAIVNAYSGLVLDDPNSSTTNGTPMDQWQWNGGLNQQWFLVRA
jgi:hypothetical protein